MYKDKNQCSYCSKEHKSAHGECPERTYAWQKGLGMGVGRIVAYQFRKGIRSIASFARFKSILEREKDK